MKSRKPLTDEELEEWENNRNLEAELLESIRQMTAGKIHVVISPIISARKKIGLTQAEFAKLLGVSRTLQEWEQDRRQPSGAAKTLIAIAERHPDVLKEIAA